jgi:3-oxoacyl-[acyl-carrier protein] reductase
VGEVSSLSAFLEGARSSLGRIDVLVNNASAIALLMPDEDEAWRASVEVDMMGAVHATRKVVPWMAEQGAGAIVHIASIAGRMYLAPAAGLTSGPSAGPAAAYAAMKAAMISHAKSSAGELASQRIRVNTVVPGPIEWPDGGWETIRKNAPAVYADMVASIPSRRLGTPEEVADAVLFLASHRASWITGAVLNIDGGQYPANT